MRFDRSALRISAPIARTLIAAFVILGIWLPATLGTTLSAEPLSVGDVSPYDFRVRSTTGLEIVDHVATDAARNAARSAVPPVRDNDLELEADIRAAANEIFDEAHSRLLAPPLPLEPTPLPTSSAPPTTLPAPDLDPDAETEPTPHTTLSGQVLIDFTLPGAEATTPAPLARTAVEVVTPETVATVLTASDGSFAVDVPVGPVAVRLTPTSAGIPTGFAPAPEAFESVLSCTTRSCQATPLLVQPHLVSPSEVIAGLINDFELSADSATLLVTFAQEDIVASPQNLPQRLPVIRQAVLQRLSDLFTQRVTPEQLPTVLARQLSNPPVVFFPGSAVANDAASLAAGDVVVSTFSATYLVDEDAWAEAQDRAAADEPEIVRTFVHDELIVGAGARLTQLHLDAIAADLNLAPTAQNPGALLLAVAVLVISLGFYIARVRVRLWNSPRHLLLFGTLLVLFAASLRLLAGLSAPFGWPMIPAAAFGLMAAVLFNSRTAVLFALSLGLLTLLFTFSPAAVGFTLIAALLPSPMVSAASARRDFRNAVAAVSVLVALASVVFAALFDLSPSDAALSSLALTGAWSFAATAFTCLVALALLQFFEAVFDITTTLGLLELVDRNHKALLYLQEKAFGTFNHSLMVGTLADAAARSIGANPLLARAMAYYHDLGKTAAPLYFVENQFGASSPHDDCSPLSSASALRNHVTDGLALARRFNIPSDVAHGIRCHHGDSLMRSFYAKAVSEASAAGLPAPSPDDFRHVGTRPDSAETAIVMLADSVEAASRAVFASTESTPEAIESLVDSIVDDKLSDGQLTDAPLTLNQLSRIRRAFCEALAGFFHQRIPYPPLPPLPPRD